jgi:hypothetical protein
MKLALKQSEMDKRQAQDENPPQTPIEKPEKDEPWLLLDERERTTEALDLEFSFGETVGKKHLLSTCGEFCPLYENFTAPFSLGDLNII